MEGNCGNCKWSVPCPFYREVLCEKPTADEYSYYKSENDKCKDWEERDDGAD